MVARILVALGRDGNRTAASLMKELQSARSTTYALVDLLDRSGLVDRSHAGRLMPGQMSAALGLAALGIGNLASAAEALLPVLRDHADASISLIARHDQGETVVMQRLAASDPALPCGAAADDRVIEQHIPLPHKTIEIFLRLHIPPAAKLAERTAMRSCLTIVATALSEACRTCG